MIPRHERMDLHVNPKFKQLIMDQRGKTETLGDAVVRLVCQALQIDPHIYALERLPAGTAAT